MRCPPHWKAVLRIPADEHPVMARELPGAQGQILALDFDRIYANRPLSGTKLNVDGFCCRS